MVSVLRKVQRPPFGTNVVGYLEAELGVAEVARQVISALDSAAVPMLPIALEAPVSRHDHRFPHTTEFVSPFSINLMCVNADQTPSVAAQAGADFFDGRYTIGLWWWEIATIPDFFAPAFEAVDEVWAASNFIADSLRAVAGDVPVTRVPLPITVDHAANPDRERFGFADSEVAFFFMFDYRSIVARKNPGAVIDAYIRAFPEPGRTRLIIKSINGDENPEARDRLREMAADRADVELLEDYLSASDRDSLMASCDCYVSLHRSEGFGLTCAEAMAFGKPVIATSYSGSADYMLPGHSLPVGYTMVPVGEGSFPYPPEAEWAEPDVAEAATHMRAIADSKELRERLGAAAQAFVRDQHNQRAVGAALAERLHAIDAHVHARPVARARRRLDARALKTADRLRALR